MERRNFLRNTTLATAGVTVLNFPIFGKQAPSNKVVLGVMGLNGRGSYLANCYAHLQNVEVGYLCDIEEGAIKRGFDAVKDLPRRPELIRDIRKLVERKDMDALIVAAPDHWHTPAAILGSSHGKHVYVEKPCGQNPYEGELIVQAMHKFGKHIQMGNQRRSMPTLIEAVRQVRDGIIGDVYFAKAWYTNNRKSIGKGKQVAVPSTLDFDLWQGPAPRRPYQDNLVHYNWHWFWHWGTGESCNNGTHELDCCRWFLGVDFPTKATSAGGRYAFSDDWQTPDTQVASFEFGDKASITWENRSCQNFPVEGSGRGFVIYGKKGTLVNHGGGDYQIFDIDNKLQKDVKSEVAADPNNTLSATGNLDLYHFNNFVNTIRGDARLNAPVDEAYKSVLLCHLANIAQRTGETLLCDPSNGHLLNSTNAMKLWRRTYEPGWEPVV
ncbi:MAG: Gfo/Idh/MocA family oxidoreductase [Bacteroidota bacterium]|nr:Gfo/Idh/MocA family oxidoreductase [Bacteroidota bacterium]MDP4217790.1 Gfo/Idh/MocA family oxidoreductase [Bacteroidota bacterium]MDP4246812.1 Gfo/Idh/MocA family oxidoreductase [Bacteroidota bacterium]MDP4255707.1 Gfo/Idh/MocA family oxidoreductase [Bacteroidota bacterium]MDP4258149.1 Gfo/Idh/MocA family oxidoreductase [Bacteroidota bacterium]